MLNVFLLNFYSTKTKLSEWKIGCEPNTMFMKGDSGDSNRLWMNEEWYIFSFTLWPNSKEEKTGRKLKMGWMFGKAFMKQNTKYILNIGKI